LVVEFLEYGLFDRSKLAPIIDRYVAEKQNVEAREKANQFLFKVFWDHRLSDAHLLELASELPAIASQLDPYVASALDIALNDIPGGATIGEAIVEGWITAFKAQPHELFNDDNPFNHPLHKAIVAEFSAIDSHVQARTTVLDACMHVMENGGWGTMQEVAMKSATAADFESAIRSMEIEKLRRFMRRMIEMRLQRQTYDQHFGTATECFIEACRTIANAPDSGRLAGLIKRLFSGTVLGSELVSQQPKVDPTPAMGG
jgi:hypothetical protein